MTGDPWAEATFDGLEQAQRRRVAAWSAAERLAWLDDTLAELDELGLLAQWREHRQRETTAAWERGPDRG
jgi:hypothetical protein